MWSRWFRGHCNHPWVRLLECSHRGTPTIVLNEFRHVPCFWSYAKARVTWTGCHSDCWRNQMNQLTISASRRLRTNNSSSHILKKSQNHGVFCRRLTRTPLPTNFPSLENAECTETFMSWEYAFFIKSGSFEAIKPEVPSQSLCLAWFQVVFTWNCTGSLTIWLW